MNLSSKLLLRTAIIVLGLLLALSVFVAVNSQSAKALDSTQWDHVRGYINSYFSGEATGGNEAGLIYGKDTLMHNLGGDTGTVADKTLASYLGEGDDMAHRPVMIDNLMNNASGTVPGTEFRCDYATDSSCFGAAAITAVKSIVDNHAAAGFSTDIIDYCATSHTAAPTTAGFGIIAQTGALESGASIPKVYELYYSRQGWANTYANPTAGANAVAAPETSAGGFSPPAFPTTPSCAGTDAQVVECAANWAIASTLGNVGNGTSTLTDMTGAGQTIDVRPGSIQTLSTAGKNVQAPLNTLFSSATLAQYVDPSKTTLVASASQHGGQAAMGLKMLGYSMVTGGYINSGVYRWSSSATPYTLFVPTVAYPLNTSQGALTKGPGVTIDTSAPTITGVSAAATGTTTADVNRTSSEVVTDKIDLVGSDSSVVHVNNTVLHSGSRTTNLTGLTPNTTYTGTIVNYDVNANGTSNAISFTTPPPPDTTPPTISSIVPAGYVTGTTSANVSVYYSDNVGVTSATVSLDGTDITSGCTVTADYASCTVNGLAEGNHTIGASASDAALNTTTSSGSFFIDTYFPRVSSIMPRYTNVASGNITATLRDTLVLDPAANSGNNLSSLNVTLDSGDITSTCTATPTDANNATISCPFAGLSEGSHPVVISYKDNAGNPATGTRTMKVDFTAPTVSDLAPTGTISTSSATLVGYYSDSNSGIKSTTAVVTLDGSPVAGCTATATKVTCDVTGLADGPHSFTVSVQDNATNTGSASGSFTVQTCTPAKPALSLAAPSARWASFADYTARIVTVDWTINNTGTNNAANVQITGGTNSAPVTFADTLPTAGIGINAGSSGTISVRYNVPVGVLGWHASITASAVDPCDNTSYTYPV